LPGDRDVAALERLAERVDDVGAEQRELVHEEHTAMSPADLARPHLTAAAAHDAGLARVVVRRRERRPDEHAVGRVEHAGQ
jgi:hypothetical protein